MKDQNDIKILEFFPVKTELRGRPRNPAKKTNAQKQAEYRARKAALPNPLGGVLVDEVSQLRARIAELEHELYFAPPKNLHILANERCMFADWMDRAIKLHPDLINLKYGA